MYLLSFLIPPLYCAEWSFSFPRHFTAEVEPMVLTTVQGVWVGRRASLGVLEKRETAFPAGTSSHYTEYATPVPTKK